jgi:antigen, putative
MKKTLIFILMILVLIVSSCNLFLKEEYGELVLSFDGTLPDGARALDSNGLPVLSSSPMKINIIREDGYTITRELSAEEPKSLVELVPVGEKIEIIVTAINPSGQWSGRAFHTVVSGQNHVKVLLNKNISGLNNLLFTQTKDLFSAPPYNLTLYMNGKEINAHPSQSEYSFGRDSLGRLYISVNEGNAYIYRYTSEGELLDYAQRSISCFANDYTTGKIYGIDGYGDVYEIKENLSLSPAPIANLEHYQGAAAIDNNRVAWTWKDAPNSLEIKVDTLGTTSTSGTGPIRSHINIVGCKESKVNDLFIRGNYVYVLFNTMNDELTGNSRNLYSLGGVVRYNINNLTAPPVKIGFSNSVSFENSLLKNYDYSANFYGAVKVIGFDEENIYIADDGFDAADTPAGARIVKNRNRIAALNIATNALSFSDAGPAKWYNEWKEWRTPNTKMIVWESLYDGSSRSGMSYYQVEKGDENLLGANSFITSDVSNPTGVLYSDVFCYDSAGNFYVSGKDNSDEKLYRYVLKDDGNYETDGEKDISEKPTTIAVSVSSVPDDAGKTILFYYFESGNGHNIGRLAWYTDDFANAVQRRNITLNDLDQNDTVTAMMANKDGIFVAVKTVTGKDSPNEKYKITVKKYAHQPLGSPAIISAVETVTVVDETSTNYPNVVVPPSHWTAEQANAYINEDLNALYISDGVLYGLTTNQKGYIKDIFSKATEVFIGGKLLKIGNTKSLGSYVVVLYKNDGLRPATSGEFAPYRFIAVKPKKLVIASDGYYGKGTAPRNKNKVFVFDIGNWAHPDETVTQTRINLSKQLGYSGNSFIWTIE